MLEKFGFTPTEDKVYQALLKLGPTTGYAVAQELGIARANVYHSLESLVRQGAAKKSSSNPIRYSGAGPSALLAELERSFKRDLSGLEEALQSLPIARVRGSADLEMLVNADQVLDRAASCADSAITELLVVTGAWAGRLNARLASATARRVQVRAVSLSADPVESAIVRPVETEQLRAYWGGLPVAIVADRGRAVAGIITPEGGSGMATSSPGVIPFLRHLLRREVAGG